MPYIQQLTYSMLWDIKYYRKDTDMLSTVVPWRTGDYDKVIHIPEYTAVYRVLYTPYNTIYHIPIKHPYKRTRRDIIIGNDAALVMDRKQFNLSDVSKYLYAIMPLGWYYVTGNDIYYPHIILSLDTDERVIV
jgi:5-methylcytosine-specific restriction endonuclease McrA